MKGEAFIYEWRELTKARRVTPKLILQAVALAIAVGFVPDLVMYMLGHSETYAYQFRFMLVAVPVVLFMSVVSVIKKPESDVTTSALVIDGDFVVVKRHVIAQTGRRFFVEWYSIGISAIKIDEMHRTIQFNAKWKVNAYRDKNGKAAGYVDSDVREHPQTFQLTPESYYEAVRYLEENGCRVEAMTEAEYEKARPFIHKHYEL